ncbi:Bax inhibitor-1/YccA family membrane protein [Corynebacterium uropygiale]|uniref:Bax inhibitor-1/YccA family protein n=1 Tax=Corynebacterium uropygiale TaxID=1775911 RepID=UPI003B83A0D7
MRSSNPVMKTLTHPNGHGAPQGDPFLGTQAGQYSFPPMEQRSTERPMTVDDVVTKTGITLAVIVALGIVNFAIGATVSYSLSSMLTIVGAIGGLITVLVATFGRKFGSAAVTLIYAAFEGLFVGGISLVLSGFVFGRTVNAGLLIGQAVLGTVGVFLGMLFVYKIGAVKVTPKFTRILSACLMGVVVLALGNVVLSLFGLNLLRAGGLLSIIFSLVCIGLAAASFLVDFDSADEMIRAGAPAKAAWGIALGLAVTLVWLYTEILRLLSIFQQR